MAGDMIRSLGAPLEMRASLTAPSDVRVCRVQCLAALALVVAESPSLRPPYLDLLWSLLGQQPSTECDADAQVWNQLF